MLRKLTVLICLLSFAPAAVNAQGIATVAAPPASIESSSVPSAQPAQALNLSLPAENTAAVLMAAAETSQGAAMASAPENKKEAQRSFNWGNFTEVHLGGYRWVWWAGAAVALIAIHAGAN
ncbi:MAG: hypothetical protein HGB32_07085 [Geobacteraceae bacterium]|nr:hypothetical protein [Geobacteraceae bacterium]NTW79896.1 hypothetical protein [Geobacteraceae bacterium]